MTEAGGRETVMTMIHIRDHEFTIIGIIKDQLVEVEVEHIVEGMLVVGPVADMEVEGIEGKRVSEHEVDTTK